MPRRVLEGQVVSAKTDKTVTVLVERKTMHPVYKKYVKSTKRYAAHDEFNQFKAGDKVEIMECRPISKSKRWTVVNDGKGIYKPRAKATDADMGDDKYSPHAIRKDKPAAAPAPEPKKAEAKKTDTKAKTIKKTAKKDA